MNVTGFGTRMACLVLILVTSASSVFASENSVPLQLSNGQELEISRFAGSGEPLVLWLPSERGIRAAHTDHARALAALGHETWLADLHASYFVERNRSSIGKFSLDDTVALIDAATRASEHGVILLSSSRGAQLALIGAREWQLQNPGKTGIKGLFLVHPYLYAARPGIGEVASYLPIAEATNLPVYLLDTQYSTRGKRLDELAARLGHGGSQVFIQVLKGVQGGFFVREKSDLGAADQVAREQYATTIHRAINAMKRVAKPDSAAVSSTDTRLFSRSPKSYAGMTPVGKPMPAPALQLEGLNTQTFSLRERRGQVVLVNFWATWCRPCVDEIPSLHRLREKIDNPEFEIITVNVGEEQERIAKFIKKVPVELPLLMDYEGIVSNAWRVYVYPSSYLVDKNGQISYAYLGALEWDSPENITIIQSLLKRP